MASRNLVRCLRVASEIFLNIMLANLMGHKGNKGNKGNTREHKGTKATKGNKG